MRTFLLRASYLPQTMPRRFLLLSLFLLVSSALFAQSAGAGVGPDLSIVVGTPTIDPGLPFGIGVYYYNVSDNAAPNVTARITLPAHVRVVTLPDGCTQSGQVITCAVGDVPAHYSPDNSVNFLPDKTITAVVDDPSNGQALHITGDISTTVVEGNLGNNHYDNAAKVFRTFFVTDGGDSLANAIDEVNLACTDDYPCKIAFRLGTLPEAGFFTVRPHRALPKITAKNVSIDGTTQTRATDDTNANGPEVFIDGSANAWEDGIVFAEPCAAELTGVAIGNFRNAAVTLDAVSQSSGPSQCPSFTLARSIHDNFLGVDPSGTQAAPNGRGIVVNENLFNATAITNNLISGNLRSGIWIGVAFRNPISGNTIGIDIRHQPLANGASGIYVGPRSFDVDIRGNYIAFNHDFGVAIDRRAIGTDVGPNSIYANLQLGIDVGLDGPTPDRDVPAPVVLSAQYDAATNTTQIEVSSHEAPSIVLPTLTLYASDAPHPSGYGDGQYLLGVFRFNTSGINVFTFAAAGDWRGKWVSATVTRNNFFGFLRTNAVRPNADGPDTHSTTSEFSRAVKVE